MSNKISPCLQIFWTTLGIRALTICLLILLTVGKISKDVLEKENYSLDKSFLLWLAQWSNPKLDKIMVIITQLGDFNIVIIVITITLTILFQKSYYQEAKFFLIACFGHPILADGMKLLYVKPRPKLWSHLVEAGSFSFPSGHAVGAVIVYGFIAFLLSSHYPNVSGLIYSLVFIIIVLIGFSRLYVGVHWPTDVIAGYGIGFLWLTVCLTLLKIQKLLLKC